MKTIVRYILLSAVAAIVAGTASAQKLVIGERTPDMKVQKWLTSAPATDGKNVFVEFYYSANEKSPERLKQLNALAAANTDKIVVVVLSRDEIADASLLSAGNPAYYPAIDDGGRTFASFGVKYIPYAVLYDKRGRILWLGNPASMSNDDIIGYIK